MTKSLSLNFHENPSCFEGVKKNDDTLLEFRGTWRFLIGAVILVQELIRKLRNWKVCRLGVYLILTQVLAPSKSHKRRKVAESPKLLNKTLN